MSRRPVPSRVSILLFTGCAAAAALLALSWAAPAHAQAAGLGTRTVFAGSGNLGACSAAAARGDVSDHGISACSAALQQRPEHDQEVAILVNRGVIHMHRQEYALALADFEATLRIAPNNTSAMFNKGMAQVQLRQSGPAVATLTEALSRGMETPYLAYYFRGVARERLGDIRGAYEDYSTALDIQPRWAPAEQEMARFAQGRRQELASELSQTTPHP